MLEPYLAQEVLGGSGGLVLATALLAHQASIHTTIKL